MRALAHIGERGEDTNAMVIFSDSMRRTGIDSAMGVQSGLGAREILELERRELAFGVFLDELVKLVCDSSDDSEDSEIGMQASNERLLFDTVECICMNLVANPPCCERSSAAC